MFRTRLSIEIPCKCMNFTILNMGKMRPLNKSQSFMDLKIKDFYVGSNMAKKVI